MINGFVLDHGLWIIPRTTTRLLLHATLPVTYEDATDPSNVIGQKVQPVIVGPMDATPNGRKVVVDAISDGVINISGQATSWSLVDDNVDRLLVAELLVAPIDLEVGNSFITEELSITMPGQL
jgi:hypothetical protein